MSTTNCFICGSQGTELFGFHVCSNCKKDMGLFTEATVKKYMAQFSASGKNHSYEQEVLTKLQLLELVYRKKKIKLLSILEKINELK